MNVINDKIFLTSITAPTTSEPIGNSNLGELLTLEISGTSTEFELVVEGIVDINSTTWTTLGWISVDNNVGTTITTKGIYEIVAQNLSKIRVDLTSISNGNISVYGRMCGGGN